MEREARALRKRERLNKLAHLPHFFLKKKKGGGREYKLLGEILKRHYPFNKIYRPGGILTTSVIFNRIDLIKTPLFT